jgi:hypothetical protein
MFTNSRFTLGFALLAFIFIATAPAQASTTIFTSFTSPPAYSNNASSTSYLHVNGTTFSPSFSEIAAPFTPTQDTTVDSVDLLLGWAAFASANQVVDVGIYSDSSDEPGTQIGDLTPVTVTAALDADAPAVFTASIANVSGPNDLVAGTQYWVVVSPTVDNTFVGWFYNQGGGTATYAKSINEGTSWTNATGGQLYFDVNGTPTGGSLAPGSTPEPGTLVLLGLGLGAVALRRRQRAL